VLSLLSRQPVPPRMPQPETSASPSEDAFPYINARGELIIPCDAPARFRYWQPGSQSIAQTLLELNATPDVWQRYVGAYIETLQ